MTLRDRVAEVIRRALFDHLVGVALHDFGLRLLVVEAQVSGWTAWADETIVKPSRFRLTEGERGAEILARYGGHQCVECAAQLRAERAGELRCTPCARHVAVDSSVRASDDRGIWRSRATALKALERVVR